MPQPALILFPDSISVKVVAVFDQYEYTDPNRVQLALDWILCAAEDALTRHLQWASPSRKTESLLENVSFGLNKDDIMTAVESILKVSIRDPIWNYCKNPWLIYHTSCVQRIFYLERDIDYRIAEWHRLTDTPE